MTKTPATERDVEAISRLLESHQNDAAIFARKPSDIRRHLEDFIVARDSDGRLVACAALHQAPLHYGEILSVAVSPEAQGRGIGTLLLRHCLRRADDLGTEIVWLATVSPSYFARFGFVPVSRWNLPVKVLLRKLGQTFQQPMRRWLPALLGRFTFMRLDRNKARL